MTKEPKVPLFEFVEKYGGSADVVDWYAFVRRLYEIARQQDKARKQIQIHAAPKIIQDKFRQWKKWQNQNKDVTAKEQDSYDRNIDENVVVVELRRKFETAPESLK